MASVNKVILVGNLGRDPEVRYSSSGSAITSLSIATTYSSKQPDGTRKEETEWHRVVTFNRLAEIAGEYLRKGRSVYIEGRLRTRKWTDSNGQDRYTTEIVADQMQMLGGRGDDARDQQPAPQQQQQRPVQQAQVQRQAPQQNYQAENYQAPDADDDIPF